MATLWITEFQKLGDGPRQGGIAQVGRLPAVAEQTITMAGASAQSSVFNASTNMIRVHTDTPCHILVGSNPTATTAKLRLAGGATEYFAVTPGEKIAVIQGV